MNDDDLDPKDLLDEEEVLPKIPLDSELDDEEGIDEVGKVDEEEVEEDDYM